VVRSKSKNSYDLFWHILELAVPGFDPTVPIEQPRWIRNTDILEFCRSHKLYLRHLAKRNIFYNSWTRTNMFLHGISLLEYADIITMIKSNLDMYRHADENCFLPQHLCLNRIVKMLHEKCQGSGPRYRFTTYSSHAMIQSQLGLSGRRQNTLQPRPGVLPPGLLHQTGQHQDSGRTCQRSFSWNE
jgi:hypothetical protein